MPDWQKKATCHHFGKVGHVKPNCPKLNKDENDDKKDNSDNGKKPKPKKKKFTLVQLTNEQMETLKNVAGDDSSVELQGVGFCTMTNNQLSLRWKILLENQATVDVFCSRALLDQSMDVRQVDDYLW